MKDNTDNRFWQRGAYTGAPAVTPEDSAVVAVLRELEESRGDYTGGQLTEIERLLRRVYRAGVAIKPQRRRRKVTMPMATTAVVAVNGKGEQPNGKDEH
jgi:hypothetical protein